MPTPSILYSMALSTTNTLNTPTMTVAALVITPALRPTPSTIAVRASAPAAHRSRIRLTTKMW